MSNEEKILSMLADIKTAVDDISVRLGRVEERLDRVEERLDRVEERLDRVEQDVAELKQEQAQIKVRLDKVEEDTRWTRLTIENEIRPNIRLLAEGHEALLDRMATKEQLQELREDLDIQKFKIEVLATRPSR